MKRALELAKKAEGQTSPNPMVGAVIVKNGKIISEGYHHKAGSDHAEIVALKKCQNVDMKGATLFVTLEPCCHTGKKTPPCVERIKKSGIHSVVIAVKDPNPKVNGKGCKSLKKNGIRISMGLLQKEATQLNAVFFKNMKLHMPFITLKLGMSLDGKIATHKGESKWITNKKSRIAVHKLRSRYDAILTSSHTVIEDNPHLGSRIENGKDPLRIIIDRELKTSPKAEVYRDNNCLVITTKKASPQKIKIFQEREIPFVVYEYEFSIKNMLKDLYHRGITSLLMECGGKLTSAFLKEKVIDKCFLFYGAILIGEEGKNGIGKLGLEKLSKAIHIKNIRGEVIDNNMIITGDIER